jgi:hypothetical protein
MKLSTAKREYHPRRKNKKKIKKIERGEENQGDMHQITRTSIPHPYTPELLRFTVK